MVALALLRCTESHAGKDKVVGLGPLKSVPKGFKGLLLALDLPAGPRDDDLLAFDATQLHVCSWSSPSNTHTLEPVAKAHARRAGPTVARRDERGRTGFATGDARCCTDTACAAGKSRPQGCRDASATHNWSFRLFSIQSLMESDPPVRAPSLSLLLLPVTNAAVPIQSDLLSDATLFLVGLFSFFWCSLLAGPLICLAFSW
ncbi:hypothetical protein BJ166DRAFT_299699 [Pestalotiopsis sp. NC0098]|nr:hypothetical protein BJ166DRAFT_299699 [Pestalotiopsis sp. NC0098]